MLERKEVKRALSEFGENVILTARANFRSKTASGKGSESMGHKVTVSENSFEQTFSMEQYMIFQDRGVTGNNASDFKGKRKTVQRSLSGFSFGSGNFRGTRDQWEKQIDKWMYSRGIIPRNFKSGQFITRKSANFLIRRSIYQHGIKPNKFFTNAFENEFKNLPKAIEQAYALDVERFMQTSLDNRKK